MPIRHAFTSAKSDGSDATKVRPSNWNADHTHTESSVGLQIYRRKANVAATEYEFASREIFISTDYNFPAQSVAVALSIGSNSITLVTGLLGVAGSDSNHYLRIVDSVGGNEVVLITGGTVTSGVAGTLIFTCALSHASGNWTIVSATAGTQEALNAAILAGSFRHVFIPSGRHLFYAPVNFNGNSNVSILGAKGQTYIDVSNFSGFTSFAVNVWVEEVTPGNAYAFMNSGGGVGTVTDLSANVNYPVITRFKQTTLTIAVASVPGDWAIGDYISMQYMGWGVNAGAPAGQQEFCQIARISNISGTNITFEERVVIPLALAAVAANPGNNKSQLKKVALALNISISDLVIDGTGGAGTRGGIGLFFVRDSSIQNIQGLNLTHGCIVLSKGYKNIVQNINTYNCSLFSDVWLGGQTHLILDNHTSVKPNFGLGVWWSTFCNMSNLASHNSQGRGLKFHGLALSNITNIIVSNASVGSSTGVGVQGGSFQNNITNIQGIGNALANLYMSGEGNICNRIINVNMSQVGSGAELNISGAFGFDEAYNTITGIETSGSVTLTSNLATHTSYSFARHQRSFAYASAAQAINDATQTALTFNTNVEDIGDVHSVSVNTSRFTVTIPGTYIISGQCHFVGNATGSRQIFIRLNGTTNLGGNVHSMNTGAGNNVGINVSQVYFLNVNDYIEFVVIQNSGGALNTVGGQSGTFGSVQKLY